eukprot:Nk52_evm63s153 gene=Nk52_evmTU63s153
MFNGLGFANEMISIDEGIHTEFGIELYSLLAERIHEEHVHEIIREAVDLETEFVNDSLQCALIGMNSELMTEHIQYFADRLLVQMNYSPVYDAKKSPFYFIERLGMSSKNNFFESKVSQYTKAGTGSSSGFVSRSASSASFRIDEDF